MKKNWQQTDNCNIAASKFLFKSVSLCGGIFNLKEIAACNNDKILSRTITVGLTNKISLFRILQPSIFLQDYLHANITLDRKR